MSFFPYWPLTSPFPVPEHPRQEPPSSGLFLLGTLHHDPRGFTRLRRFLDHFKPDLVCVEISPYGLHYRKRYGPILYETLRVNLREAARRSDLPVRTAFLHPQIVSIRRQISLPFEYRAARAYAEFRATPRKASLIMADWSPFSRRCIETWPELLSVDNLFQLLRTPVFLPSVTRAYAEAASQIHADAVPRFTDASASPPQDEEDALRTAREEHMARLIEHVCRRYPDRRTLYVGGWWHLRAAGPHPTLRTLLHVDASRCLLLDRL